MSKISKWQAHPWYDITVGSANLVELSIMIVNSFISLTSMWLSNARNHYSTAQYTSNQASVKSLG